MFRTAADPAGMHVLVTGAASGMGRAIAEQLAARGATLHLTDLRQEALDEVVAGVRAAGGAVAVAQAADLTDVEAVRALAARVHRDVDAVDAVLNVAGIATWGTVETLTYDDWKHVVDVNLMGPIAVIDSFVPAMVRAGRGGHLVNVSSAAGLIALPWHAPYSAGKFGLRGVSEVLRFDLARHGIAVTLVCPGGVDTPLTDTVTITHLDKNSPAFRRAHQRFRDRAVSADRAAEAIVTGMLERRYLVFTSPDVRRVFALQRHAPPVYALAMRALHRVADRVAARAALPVRDDEQVPA